jgi:PAS domain S-box-containing protein
MTVPGDAEADRADRALRASEARYRRLFETAQDGILLLNSDTAQIEDANPFLIKMLGYTHAEFVGRKLWEVGAFADVAQSKEMFVELQTRGYVRYEDLPLRTRTGVKIAVEFVSDAYEADGVRVIQCNVRDISERKLGEDKVLAYIEELRLAIQGIVQVATAISEMRDPYTAGHQRRVAELAVAIGTELGFDERKLEGLRVAGYLHDIGKISIPAEMLSKPGKLTAVEYQMVQGHAQASHDALQSVSWPWPVAEIVLQHHERMDGTSYPRGLRGEAILSEARVIAVADVVEAMASHRPNRAALGIDLALKEIEAGSGTRYDPAVVGACLRLFRDKAYVLAG